ncbi:MAG: B12-binding domain-containing radical SAM protein, partial [Planctomycetota bacterium]
REHLNAGKPDLVGIYANVITREISLDMTREARELKYPVVLGGPDPTGDADAYLEAGAMAVVLGEGEHTMLDLADRFQEKGPELDLNAIPGLLLPNGDKPIRTEGRERINDLDSLPLPDRTAIDLEQYMKAWKNRHGYSSLSLITSRGCPFNCTWCSKEIFGCLFRQRSPENVIAELKHLKEQFKPDQLWFADDVLTLNKKWASKLTRAMVDAKIQIPFECLSRVDRVDEEVVEDLKRAGCFRLWYGAESGSEKIVKNMRKDFTVSQVMESVKFSMEAGIEVGLFILIGYPGEKLVDLLKTLKMIRKLAPHYCGSSVAFPIKGTQFYDDVRHLLSEDYAWSRRNENRLSFRGRYPALFYWFAVRLIHNWAAFWSVRTRKDSVPKRLLRALKFVVAGCGVIAIGTLYELKQKFSPSGT